MPLSLSYFGKRRDIFMILKNLTIFLAIVATLFLMLRQDTPINSSQTEAQWYSQLGYDEQPRKPIDDNNVPVEMLRKYSVSPLAVTKSAPLNFDSLNPFYLHYIRLRPNSNNTDLRFTEFLSVMSGVQYLKPDGILLHSDFTPTGPYWENLTNSNLIKQVPLVRPTNVGIRLRQPKKIGFIEHSADIAKLDVLLRYGGIAVDFDVFFVRGQRIKDILQKKKSITCYGDEDSNNIGLVAGHKDSKFLSAWRRSYRDIYVAEWNFNQGFVSTFLTALFPEDVYVLDHVCNNPHPDRDLPSFFQQYGKLEWKNSAAIHSYKNYGGKNILSPEDLINGSLTTYTEILQYIYFNKTLSPMGGTFQDEITAAP